MEERHLSLSEVAELLDKSERTIRRWIKSGKLKAYKPGRDYVIPESAISELMEKSEVYPKLEAPLPFEELSGAGPQSLTSLSQAEFLNTLSAASESDEGLLEVFRRIDAERLNLELVWREDEANHKAHDAYGLAVDRRLVVFLTLYERGLKPPYPEKASLAEQLQEAMRDR